MAEEPMLLAGHSLGHYRVISLLAAGGMGEVYLAEDTRLKRKVALKLLSKESTQDPDRIRRFEQEARAASALNHPNILMIFEIGQRGSTHYIATEFIEGETLRERLAKSRMSVREVLDSSIQTASALAAAHDLGIIHRDIKPENIMLRPDGYIKVLDFGLAKLMQQQSSPIDLQGSTILSPNTEPGTVMGTVAYMSPEQVRALVVDERSDIFSLGVVIYEMVAGCAPFSGDTPSDVIASILTAEPAPLDRYSSEVSPGLQRIVSKSLCKDRNQRYQTARELLEDLKKVRRALDVSAEIEGRPESKPAYVQTNAHMGKRTTAPTTDPATDTAPNTWRFIDRMKRHKLSAVIAVGVIGLSIFAQYAYLHFRNSSEAFQSIAVLPFENQNRDPEMEYRSDGLTESIIYSLTQLQNLRVMARSSVFRYKGSEADPREIGRQLGVRAVLTGRMMQHGDDLVISAELTDVQDNKQLWGEQFQRKVSDLLAVQQEIAEEISSSLRLKLSGEDQTRLAKHYTRNEEAYQLYLKGRFYWNKRTSDGVSKSIECFNEATEKDPSYALAYSGLADCYASLGASFDVGSLTPSEAFPKAKASAMEALRLDDTLAEAETSLAFIKLTYDWDWAGAERDFRRAIELNPNYDNAHHWYSHYLIAMGRTEESLAQSQRALELDRLGLIINVHLGWNYLLARQYDESIGQLLKTLDMEPNYGLTHWYLGLAYEQKSMYPEALAELKKAQDLLKENITVAADIGHVYAVSGRRDEAEKIIDELKDTSTKRYVSANDIALIYAGLGENDQAFEWLEKAFREHSDLLVYLRVEPRLDVLRPDPRFPALMRRIGLER